MIRPVVAAAVIAVGVGASAAAAHAYPQFQIGKEQVCASCHIAPGGGGLLDGMGPVTAEEIATFGGNPDFLHGAIELPAALKLGGDLRAAAGLQDHGGGGEGALFPMQAELYGAYRGGPITVYATLGYAVPAEGEPENAILAREHWVMYRKEQFADPGIYVRAGRFMPIYGLRYAEHPLHTRRWGGTPLYSETYGVNFGYLSPGAEVHVTAFLRDRLRTDTQIERGDGFAVYGEKRFTETLAAGAQARYAKSADEWRAQGGLTGKVWLPAANLQVGAELQFVRQKFDQGDGRNQLVGTVLASWQRFKGFQIDLALNHFDEDLDVKDVDRDAVDLYVHWYAQSHVELVLMNRVQMIGFGSGGDTSYFSLLQLHYRI